MRGEVLTFEVATGEGAIAGDDGVRYGFAASDLRGATSSERGQRVDFVPGADLQATEIFILQAVAPPTWSGQAVSRGGQFDLGRVIQRTFTTIRENAAIFFGASTVMVGAPSAVMA